ncbi:hypothetical protein RFI_10752, partial [Reticulomyxa filosa]
FTFYFYSYIYLTYTNDAFKQIVCLRHAEELGTPVPERELFGHTKSVHCLRADEANKRLFSAGFDNSICVWSKNEKLNDFMQLQVLKSVHKSNGFTCLLTMPNIDCIAAGTDNGYVTIWHECPYNEPKPLYVDQIRANSADQDQSQATVENRNNSTTTNLQYQGSEPLKPSIDRIRAISEQMIRSKYISTNNLFNGSIMSQKSVQTNKVWKCVYSWKAHSHGKVTSMEYIEKDNVLVTSGEDGCVRVVYVCHPELFPSVQVTPKDNHVENSELSFADINKNRLVSAHYSPIVQSKLSAAFDEIHQRDQIHYQSKFQK